MTQLCQQSRSCQRLLGGEEISSQANPEFRVIFSHVMAFCVQSACILSFFFFSSFYGCTCSMWKFLGQGLNSSYSRGLRRRHGDTRSELHL